MSDIFQIPISLSPKLKQSEKEALESYSKYLSSNDVPVIYNAQHLSQLLGVKLEFLYAVSNAQKGFYRAFKLKKKSGGYRNIAAPLPTLLKVQRWILDNILVNAPVHMTAKAYVKKISIKDNARLHRKPKFLFTTDVKDFFGSINEFKVSKVFYELGYSKALSVLMAKLCCLKNELPQGAPTSGYLSNIALKEFDIKVFKYCRNINLRYSRYADDISISGDDLDFKLLRIKIEDELKSIGLRMNHSKTRLLKQNNCQKVTGIIVNEKLSPPRKYLKQIRQECYYIKKFGIYGHATQLGNDNASYVLERLIGQITHALYIKPYDSFLKEQKKFLIALKKKEFQ